MFRRSRLSVRPNVKPGGRGSSQTCKADDKALTSDQQLNSEGKSSNENEDFEIPAASGSFPSTPLPNPGVEQEERDDPDEQQENVPLNKNEKNEKTGESGGQGKPSVAPLQRRKRFSTMPNLAKPRSTSLSTQQSTNLTAKSPQQQNLLTPVTNVASFQDNSLPSQATTTEKTLPKSPEKRKPSSGQHIKLPEKKTPIPQVPQFSPVKNPLHKDSAVGASSTRVPMTRKTLSSPLKERITPSSAPAKGIVPSPSVSPARPKPAKVPSDLERLRKARKLREMLKEELKKETKAHRETIPIWETNNPPERTKMTMRDFIYYLPDTNPMLSSFDEERRPSPPVLNKEPEVGSNNAPTNEEEDEESDDAVLGPRVKVAEDGSIIIDEESLTVEVVRMKTSNVVEENDPIFERGSQTTYSSFRKSTHTKPWSDKETDMFFLAISMVGTDFSMIGQLFPNRSRIEIKNKFKREEKLNSWRIDKAFKEKKPLDLDFFGELLTQVLEGEAKRKRERNGRDKSQTPRKSTTKRSRKSKKLKETESDPDDPDPIEAADHELAEADSSAITEGTEEDTQNNEAVQKQPPIKRKRKWKEKVAAEPAEREITEEPSEGEDDTQKSKCKVRQHKKGVQKTSASVSGGKDNVGKPIAEGEDESHTVADGETSSDQGASESKQPSHAKGKEKPNEEDKSFSDCESETLSGTTPPVTSGSSNESQLARPQKSKPNLKLIGRKKAGGKQRIKTAPKPSASYDDAVQSRADAIQSGADAVESRADAVQFVTDGVQSSADAIQSGADAIQSVTDAVQSRADAIQSGADAVESRADAVQFVTDAVQSRADAIQPGADALESRADAVQSGADAVKESFLQDRDACLEEPSEVMTYKQSEKDGSSSLKPETTEADKAEEITSCNVHDSDTEPRPVEKPEEPRSKPGRPVRSRFQKPKPNVGRAVVKKDVSAQGRKVATVQGSNIATQDITELSPDTTSSKESEAHQQTASNAYFAPDARILDNVPIQQDAVWNQSEGTNGSEVPASLSKSPSPDAASSGMVKSKRKHVTDSLTELPRRTWDSNKELQSEKTFQYDEQNEQEELTLAAIQENIMSKPTRSGRQPKPTTFYNPSANQQPPATSTLSEGETEGKFRSRPVRPHKTKPKVSKVLGKKEAQTKSAGKSQGTTKMTLVTLRASQEEEDDEESDVEEEDDIYPINPEEVNKAPAFVPISLRSPEPVQAQVEETMEELEIALNVSDKNYTSEAEHSLLELRDRSEPSQSCTFIPEEDYHPTTADQIELFVEVIEVPSEGPVREEEHCSAKHSDGLQDAAYKDVICVNQKNLEEESVLGSEVPSLQIVVCSTHNASDESNTESNRPDKQCASAEKDLKGQLDLQKPPFPKEDSTKAGFSSSSVTEESDGAQNNVARRRCRFPKPKPNLSKSTSRSHAIKPCPTTESKEIQSFIEPTRTALQKEKPGNEAEMNPDDSLPIQLVTIEGNEENITIKQIPTEQPNSKLSVLDGQEKHASEERMSKSQHLDRETKHLSERLNLLITDEQNKCVGEDDGMNRRKHQDSGSEHLGEKLNLLTSDDQNKCVGAGEGINRTEHMESESKHLTKTLSLLISDEKDRSVTDKGQMSNTEHLDNRIHNSDAELLTSDEQDKCVGEEEQMKMTEGPADGTEGPADGTEGPADGTEGPADGTEGPADGTERPPDGTERPPDDTEHLRERVSPAHIQLDTAVQSQDVQPGISSETYFTQSSLTLCHTADPTLSIEATETTPEVLCSGYSTKIDIEEPQNVEHQETLKTYEENLGNLMAVENPKEETIILTLVEIPASSLTEYSESSASYVPVSENTLSFAELYPPLSTENIEFAVSSEPSVEAPTIPTVSESMTVIESNPQQWSSNMPRLNVGQMDRKRNADSLIDNQNDSAKRSSVVVSSQEVLRENVPQNEGITQSNLAAFTPLEDCSAPSATNTLGNYV
ncbi:transcription factor TFIIIB component B'' homolog [Pristis pectinata]|uniref:transcription factor TFIIIB component B'' homolog n=1 Tax=Pristis pectinata TaxID=685728 RepID=UPI00223E62EE|nr:transcription factor TFIIIB component B'' homolog [Pristis pectinata]